MNQQRFDAILASALNVYIANNRDKFQANTESATPHTLDRFALTRADKYFLISQYRDTAKLSPFTAEEIAAAVEHSLH